MICVWADINPYKARGARAKGLDITLSPTAYIPSTQPIPHPPEETYTAKTDFQVLGSSPGKGFSIMYLEEHTKVPG